MSVHWHHDDFLFEEHYMRNRKSLTTEQLADAMMETVKQMTESEKSKLRDQMTRSLRRPEKIIETHVLQHWLTFPRLKEGWARIVSPEGVIEDVLDEDGVVDAAIEGNNEPHRVFRADAWDEFLLQTLRELAVRELPVSPTVN